MSVWIHLLLCLVGTLTDSRSRSQFTTCDEAKVYYESAGDPNRPTLLLVHGWACDRTFFREQLRGLSDRLHVVSIDLPGHGESDPPPRGHSADAYAEAMAAVLAAVGAEHAIIGGHSNGVPVALHFYQKYPERTSALVLIEGTMRSMSGRAQLEAMARPFRGGDHVSVATRYVDAMLPATLDESLRQFIRTRMLATSADALVGNLLACNDPAVFPVDPVEVPVQQLLVKQPAWDERYEQHVRALAPDLDYVVLEGYTHFVMLEAPRVCHEKVQAFLEQHALLPAALDRKPGS